MYVLVVNRIFLRYMHQKYSNSASMESINDFTSFAIKDSMVRCNFCFSHITKLLLLLLLLLLLYLNEPIKIILMHNYILYIGII